MAPPQFLLTAEQARHNLEAFGCDDQAEHSRSNNIKINLPEEIGEVISRASGVNLPPKTSSSVSDVETFKNPKLHLNVVSTFLATSMQIVGYVPNESYSGKVDAATEFQGFAKMISDLQRFGSYMPLVNTTSQVFDHGAKGNCDTLLESIKSFVATSGISDPTIITKDLIIQAASLTSTQKTPTVFISYHFEGADSDPLLYIFYGAATVLRTDLGKSEPTPRQKIEVSYSKYKLNSNAVSNGAEALAITIVPAESTIKFINSRFLLAKTS